MIPAHLRDRFFQRYGAELTVEILRDLIILAVDAPPLPDPVPGRERAEVLWDGRQVLLVWDRRRRFLFTFLPPSDPAMKLAWTVAKRKKRRT